MNNKIFHEKFAIKVGKELKSSPVEQELDLELKRPENVNSSNKVKPKIDSVDTNNTTDPSKGKMEKAEETFPSPDNGKAKNPYELRPSE